MDDARIPTLAEAAPAIAACRASLRAGSSSFFAASLLLPRSVRGPASALYAFCREADDLVDQGRDAWAAVHQLRARLDEVYSRPAPHDRAFAAVVAHFGIPRALPESLLEGFAWDAQRRRYETLDELHDYAARVAGTVGTMMALVMGVREPQALARASELGVAMQLSNIARDVGEDARAGRLYLPQQWLREAGIDPQAWVARPVFTPALGQVVQRVLAAAEELYRAADAGVARLPLGCRPGINAARYLYAGIGHQVARQGLDAVSRRAVVPARRKAVLLARAFGTVAPSAQGLHRPCLPATRYLVDAVQAQPRPVRTPALPWWRLDRRIDARVAWTVDLFTRLARAERMTPAP